MKKKFLGNQSANGALEMLLFLPLALFFLFVVTDVGIAFVEKGSISDALRTGLNSQVLYAKKLPLASLQFGNELRIDPSAVRELVEKVADEIALSLRKVKGTRGQDAESGFGIEVAAVLLPIDPSNGSVQGVNNWQVLSRARVPQDGVEESSANVKDHRYLAQSEFINEMLKEKATEQTFAGREAASRFSVPLGLHYRADNPSVSDFRYLGHSLLLYAEVRALSNGINRSFSKSVLEPFYAVQEQELQMVRLQID